MPFDKGIFLLMQMQLSNAVLKSLTSLESRKLHRWDLDLLRWVSWVNASASSTLANTEGAETSDGHVFTFLEALRDRVEDSLKHITCSLLSNAS